jgi:Uma2 family endonuclease
MSRPAPAARGPAGRYTAAQYLALAEDGTLGPDDRVELLEGVIVAVAPHSPEHASSVTRTFRALLLAVGDRAVVRSQVTFPVSRFSVPEPDVYIVPGDLADYDHVYPREALLVVEVAHSSVAQDRLTKTAIYARAGVPEYWIVNLRDDHVEIHRAPDPKWRLYRRRRIARRGERIRVLALPGVAVAVDRLLPSARR